MLLGARPSMGKTALALTVAQNALRLAEKPVFFSLEMPAEQIMQRLLSDLGNVSLTAIRSASLWKKMTGSVLVVPCRWIAEWGSVW